MRTARVLSHFCTATHNADPEYDFDLFVLGAGSAGVRLSRMSAGHGARVAICEPQANHGAPNYSAMGGTCVNVGCVPKKLMVYGSHFREEIHEAGRCDSTITSSLRTGRTGGDHCLIMMPIVSDDAQGHSGGASTKLPSWTGKRSWGQ